MQVYGYTKDKLSKLFKSLIASLFLYGLEVWDSAFQGKYLERIDSFIRRVYCFGYTNKIFLISDVIKNRDRDRGHVLFDLLPPKRNRALRDRGHDFILPRVLFFVSRCLFVTCILLGSSLIVKPHVCSVYFFNKDSIKIKLQGRRTIIKNSELRTIIKGVIFHFKRACMVR